ncbi:MAG: dephospho-CoA kinase [Clostridium sp.]|nr:dephospho-CoA kinase [Clostridium sp.]
MNSGMWDRRQAAPQACVVAITGGIGSGKSVVCRILEAMGYKVYDCDSRAKWLMDNSEEIKASLCRMIHPEVVADGAINRTLLSKIVFSDAEKLRALNAISHGAVREDISRWIASHQHEDWLFIETAILYQSGLDRVVAQVWDVEAPEDVRIERVMKRSGLTASEVAARIRSQEFTPEKEHPSVKRIVNDGKESLLLQLHVLLKK